MDTESPFTDLRKNNGYNEMSRQALSGEDVEDFNATEEMVMWFKEFKQTDLDKRVCKKVVRWINSTQFQAMFKPVREKTSSDTRDPNYSLWKCVAKSDYLSSILSILVSLPFVYGFTNETWTHMIDFILRKKPGVNKVHTVQIIGKMSAMFNTCLKHFSRQTAQNCKLSNPSPEQWGG